MDSVPAGPPGFGTLRHPSFCCLAPNIPSALSMHPLFAAPSRHLASLGRWRLEEGRKWHCLLVGIQGGGPNPNTNELPGTRDLEPPWRQLQRMPEQLHLVPTDSTNSSTPAHLNLSLITPLTKMCSVQHAGPVHAQLQRSTIQGHMEVVLDALLPMPASTGLSAAYPN